MREKASAVLTKPKGESQARLVLVKSKIGRNTWKKITCKHLFTTTRSLLGDPIILLLKVEAVINTQRPKNKLIHSRASAAAAEK